jgi:hypothetical protein
MATTEETLASLQSQINFLNSVIEELKKGVVPKIQWKSLDTLREGEIAKVASDVADLSAAVLLLRQEFEAYAASHEGT